MPTVQIEQLASQSKAIANLFQEPKNLVRKLDLHFELYTLRSKRTGKVKRTPSVIPFYDLPGPVIQQLVQELGPLIPNQAKEGLALIDALWERRTREHRNLAAILLGLLPESSFRRVSARIQKWALENREEGLIIDLAVEGCKGMRRENPAALLALCGRLFKKKDLRVRATGLLAIKAMLDEGLVDNLPAMLNLLIPLSRNPSKNLRPYLLQVFSSLIAISPGEALYFFQQRLNESKGLGIRWLAKQSINNFPAQEAKVLQEAING
jgi:hypothetical protein